MNGKLPVSKDSFITDDDPVQHKKHLYDLLEYMTVQQGNFIEKCDVKFKKLDSRKWWNTSAAAIGGMFGGALTVIGKWFFFKGA